MANDGLEQRTSATYDPSAGIEALKRDHDLLLLDTSALTRFRVHPLNEGRNLTQVSPLDVQAETDYAEHIIEAIYQRKLATAQEILDEVHNPEFFLYHRLPGSINGIAKKEQRNRHGRIRKEDGVDVEDLSAELSEMHGILSAYDERFFTLSRRALPSAVDNPDDNRYRCIRAILETLTACNPGIQTGGRKYNLQRFLAEGGTPLGEAKDSWSIADISLAALGIYHSVCNGRKVAIMTRDSDLAELVSIFTLITHRLDNSLEKLRKLLETKPVFVYNLTTSAEGYTTGRDITALVKEGKLPRTRIYEYAPNIVKGQINDMLRTLQDCVEAAK